MGGRPVIGGSTRGTVHRHRRTAQRGEVHPVQRPDPQRGPGRQLSLRHHRPQHRRGGRARRPAPAPGRALRQRGDRAGHGRPSSTSPASSRGPRRGRGWATSSWPPSARATPSARWSGCSRTPTSSTWTGGSHPADDIETINTELILADLQTVENALAQLAKEATQAARTGAGRCRAAEQARDDPRRRDGPSPRPRPPARWTPACWPISTCSAPSPSSTSSTSTRARWATRRCGAELAALVAPAESVVVCAQIEAEVAALDPDDAAELLAGYGQDESGLVQLVARRLRGPSACRPSSLPARRRRGPGPSTSGTPPPRRPGPSTPTSSGASSRRRSSATTTWWRRGRWPPSGPPAKPGSRARST